jgi:hypothetical protein
MGSGKAAYLEMLTNLRVSGVSTIGAAPWPKRDSFPAWRHTVWYHHGRPGRSHSKGEYLSQKRRHRDSRSSVAETTTNATGAYTHSEPQPLGLRSVGIRCGLQHLGGHKVTLTVGAAYLRAHGNRADYSYAKNPRKLPVLDSPQTH